MTNPQEKSTHSEPQASRLPEHFHSKIEVTNKEGTVLFGSGHWVELNKVPGLLKKEHVVIIATDEEAAQIRATLAENPDWTFDVLPKLLPSLNSRIYVKVPIAELTAAVAASGSEVNTENLGHILLAINQQITQEQYKSAAQAIEIFLEEAESADPNQKAELISSCRYYLNELTDALELIRTEFEAFRDFFQAMQNLDSKSFDTPEIQANFDQLSRFVSEIAEEFENHVWSNKAAEYERRIIALSPDDPALPPQASA